MKKVFILISFVNTLNTMALEDLSSEIVLSRPRTIVEYYGTEFSWDPEFENWDVTGDDNHNTRVIIEARKNIRKRCIEEANQIIREQRTKLAQRNLDIEILNEDKLCDLKNEFPKKYEDKPQTRTVASISIRAVIKVKETPSKTCGDLGPQGIYITLENGDIFKKDTTVNTTHLNQVETVPNDSNQSNSNSTNPR
jgi:hypothetical protein